MARVLDSICISFGRLPGLFGKLQSLYLRIVRLWLELH